MFLANLDKIQLLGIVFSLVILVSVFFLVRERMVKEKYSLVWLFIGLFTLVMSVFKDMMDWFSHLIGVYYPPSAFFAILLTCAYLLLLNMTVSISGLRLRNKALAQELGLLKLKVEELEKKTATQHDE